MVQGDGTGSATTAGDRTTYSLVVRSVRVSLGSDSRLMQSYAVIGTVLAVLVGVAVLLALPQWVVWSLGGGGTVAFSRAFLIVLGLVVVGLLLAPIVVAGRRHTRGSATAGSDVVLATSGYLFVLSLYLALLISAPADSRDPPPDAIAPVVEVLYGLDPAFGLVPPVVAAVFLVVAVKITSNRAVPG